MKKERWEGRGKAWNYLAVVRYNLLERAGKDASTHFRVIAPGYEGRGTFVMWGLSDTVCWLYTTWAQPFKDQVLSQDRFSPAPLCHLSIFCTRKPYQCMYACFSLSPQIHKKKKKKLHILFYCTHIHILLLFFSRTIFLTRHSHGCLWEVSTGSVWHFFFFAVCEEFDFSVRWKHQFSRWYCQ